ncbi:MAG: hypothetical protein ACKV0T_27550 [Planctomycetales bacterium]
MALRPPQSQPGGAPAALEPTPTPSRWDRVLLAGLLVWTFLGLVFPLFDTDFWWHLKTGELILARGTIPQVDWYTFTEVETPWIDLHWGFQILITGVYRAGGVNLVILFKAAVMTAAVAIGWQATGRSLPGWVKVLLWLPAAICITGRGYERPEMLSLLFLAVWLLVAFQVELRPRLIWLLPGVQLVWTNCHALFVLGLVIGACYVVDLLLREWAQGRWGLERPAEHPSPRAIILTGALVFLACFANPYFEEGALFPLTLFRKFSVDQEFYSRNIGDFEQPIQFIRRAGIWNIYLLSQSLLWLLTCGSFLWRYVACRRWSALRIGLFAAFSFLAWKATRNTNIFALVSAVVLCANVADALGSRAAGRWPLRRQARASLGVATGLVGLIVLVVTGVWNRWGDGNKPFGLGEAEHWFIHDAAKFAGQAGFPRRAFVAHIGQAAVYTYHNGPERLVFMDPRLEVCSRGTFESFLEILKRMAMGDLGWQEPFNQSESGLPVVILDSRMSRGAINGMLNNPGWRLVFADPSAAVFLDHLTAQKFDLPAVDPTPLMYPPGMIPHRFDGSELRPSDSRGVP